MSRTYRSRYDEVCRNINWLYQEYYSSSPSREEIIEYDLRPSAWGGFYRFYDKNSKEGKKKLAIYRSDGYREFKEPGPSWFRNLFTERPLRRKAKRELQKYLLDTEYEPIIESMGKLEYWT